MGTEFDSFSITAHTAYFEDIAAGTQIRNNRRILYHAMIRAGFSNLPTEWWHFDYGNRFWSFYRHAPAYYQGIFELPDECSV